MRQNIFYRENKRRVTYFLVLRIHCGYVRCSHRGKLADEQMEPLWTMFATSCEFIATFKKFKKQLNQPNLDFCP